jgi:hypothetical protein
LLKSPRVFADAHETWEVWMRLIRNRYGVSLLRVAAVASLTLLLGSGASRAMPIYAESGGLVVVEAEDFSARSAAADLPDGPVDSDPDQWMIVPGEFAGSGPFANARGDFLQVTDAGGINGEGNFSDPTGNGPFVDYSIIISTVGDYELFMRWDAPGTANNSFYSMLLDPLDVLTGSVFTFTGTGTFVDQDFATSPWDDENAIYSITTPGEYTIRLAPREDGIAIDTLVFQLTSLAAPTGNGPPATPPIPEPNTFLLAGLGLIFLARLGHRRRA